MDKNIKIKKNDKLEFLKANSKYVSIFDKKD